MSGVTWSERKPGDWLASNGRWYPASKRPKGWDFLALPPAPGHGLAHRFPHSSSDRVSANSAYTPPERYTTDGQQRRAAQPPPTSAPSASTAVAPTGRGVADATVTKMSNYKRRIEPGRQPAGALPPPPAQSTPAPPSNPPAPAPPSPPAPAQSQAPGRVANSTEGRARAKPTAIAKTSAAVYAGDLGNVLGKARKKIEEAINEAAKPD